MKPIALVLAGGEGKRFAPFITSKPLFPFLGEPMIIHTLKSLIQLGLDEVIVVGNPENEATLKKINLPSLKLTVVIQPQAKGMADALLHAEALIIHKPVLILNATTVMNKTLIETIKGRFQEEKSFIVATKSTRYLPKGYLKFKNNKLVDIIEKPGAGHEPSNIVAEVVDYIPDSSKIIYCLKQVSSDHDNHFEIGLSHYIKSNPVDVVIYEGEWFSLKNAWDVLKVTSIFLKSVATTNVPEANPFIYLEGPIYFGQNVQIMPGSIIKGPVYLGDNVVVGDNTIIRDSMVGEGSVIGAGSEIVRSYIGSNCKIHRTYLGDSILEHDINVGAGTVTANWRFDGEDIGQSNRSKLGALVGANSKLGINVSTMPGVKIGSGSIIGPGMTVKNDLPPNQKFYE